MTTFAGNYNCDMSVLANYQALMGDIFDQILAGGWVQAADTGQTDPGAVGSVPADVDYSNFAIFKPGDALTPVYLKLGFGRSTNRPAIQASLGSGTDGAGTLTGNTTSIALVSAITTAAGLPFRLSADVARVSWCLNPASADPSQMMICVVERSKDGTGTDSADHATMYFMGNTNSVGQQTVNLSGAKTGALQSNWRMAAPRPAASSSTWLVGADSLGAAFAVPQPYGYAANPSMDAGAVGSSDSFTPNTTTLIPCYGATRQYLVILRTVDDNAATKALIRYE